MEQIAFISGNTFIYWSPIVLALAATAGAAIYAAFYLNKSHNFLAMGLSVLLSVFLAMPLARLVHWYCYPANYADFHTAMTDYTTGSYALLGVFAACLLTAGVLRLVRISSNLPQMLDCMAIGGGVGISLGRLASLFNASDRGMILPESVEFPFASIVTNAVSGAEENRLATFMIQSGLAGAIVVMLLLFMLVQKLRKKKIADGDVFLIFLLAYGAAQAICDSTRYDSLFFRSNGFVSMVQIMGLLGLLVPIVFFSVRMVKSRGLKIWQFFIWTGILGLLGMAGYMEYYVQRNAHKAVMTYSVMGSCLAVVVMLGLVIRGLICANAPKEENVCDATEEPGDLC
jgi:prolipoprotein diacylglyceryltransferase